MTDIILASTSVGRRTLLAAAGIDFDVVPASLDERSAEAPLVAAGLLPEDIATALAAAKAETVSAARPAAIVIGADQVLEFDGERWSKPADMEEARRQLIRLSGRTHALHSALACARDGETVWTHLETVHITMRGYSPEFVGRYLAKVGARALTTVGAYEIEGVGIQLVDRIAGDHSAIVGLPLLPLLKALRELGALDE